MRGEKDVIFKISNVGNSTLVTPEGREGGRKGRKEKGMEKGRGKDREYNKMTTS